MERMIETVISIWVLLISALVLPLRASTKLYLIIMVRSYAMVTFGLVTAMLSQFLADRLRLDLVSAVLLRILTVWIGGG